MSSNIIISNEFYGISLSGIHKFMQRYHVDNFLNKTTTEVSLLIREITESTKLSYCEHIYNEQQARTISSLSITDPVPEIQPATIFVSHAWGYQFLHVVQALENWLTNNPRSTPVYFWFDVFSNSQHNTITKPFTWWTECFARNISTIGHTLLILEWHNPLPLKRMWCGWELACTANPLVRLDIAMNKTEESLFIKDLYTNYHQLIQHIYQIQIEKGETTYPSDKENIMKAIEATNGFTEINKKIIQKLREWMIDISNKEKGKQKQNFTSESVEGKHPTYITLLGSLAQLYIDHGNYPLAEPLEQEALELTKQLYGPNHPKTIFRIRNLGVFYSINKNYPLAEQYALEALEKIRIIQPNTDITISNGTSVSILQYIIDVGRIYLNQYKYELALPYYQEVLTLSLQYYGNKYPTTLINLTNLGRLYTDYGKYDMAETLLKQAVDIGREIYDKYHSSLAQYISNLALCYWKQEKYIEAEILYKEVLTMRQHSFGKKHINTLVTLMNLGSLYYDQGKYELSEVYLQESYIGNQEILGDKHPNTLLCSIQYSRLLRYQHKYTEAQLHCEHAYKQYLEIYTNKKDMIIYQVMYELGIVYREIQKRIEAKQYLQEVYDYYAVIYGLHHKNTQKVQLALAKCENNIELVNELVAKGIVE